MILMTAFQPEQRFGFMTSGQEEAVEKADSDIMKTKAAKRRMMTWHNCVAAVYYLAKDETLVATTAKHRLRKITLNIESRKSLKHAERID
mgnify:CR=1 FL=1